MPVSVCLCADSAAEQCVSALYIYIYLHAAPLSLSSHLSKSSLLLFCLVAQTLCCTVDSLKLCKGRVHVCLLLLKIFLLMLSLPASHFVSSWKSKKLNISNKILKILSCHFLTFIQETSAGVHLKLPTLKQIYKKCKRQKKKSPLLLDFCSAEQPGFKGSYKGGFAAHPWRLLSSEELKKTTRNILEMQQNLLNETLK